MEITKNDQISVVNTKPGMGLTLNCRNNEKLSSFLKVSFSKTLVDLYTDNNVVKSSKATPKVHYSKVNNAAIVKDNDQSSLQEIKANVFFKTWTLFFSNG